MKYMKLSLVCFFAVFFTASSVWSNQTLDDVVYLKNGSAIRGTIIEQIPDLSVKIQTRDGSIFVFTFGEIDRIAKEPSTITSPSGGKKSPGIAFVLSFLIMPGAGQVYNGEYGKGIAQFLLAVGGYSVAVAGVNVENEGMVAGGLVLGFSCSLWSCIDAPISASRINEERGYSINQIYLKDGLTVSFSYLDYRTRTVGPNLNLIWIF